LSQPNYYELLQISPNADADTIHRVYRFLANRYHPDHPITADAEKFMLVTEAYSVLSNPEARMKYDDSVATRTEEGDQLSSKVDFMDSLNGELNRRLAVLGLLYFQRRTNSSRPSISLADLEDKMGFPRDYLDFTIWYLQKKGFITRADNADFALTVLGVDFVEENRASLPLLQRLLTAESGAVSTVKSPIVTPPPAQSQERDAG